MDRYQAEMIARGPTLNGDGETPTGSVHIVGLPDPAAARAFAFDEPNYQAGVYREVLLRRWGNLLGRTMWDFPGGRVAATVISACLGWCARLPTHRLPPGQDELIAYGPLLSDDGTTWVGTAVILQAPDPEQACAIPTRRLRRHRGAQMAIRRAGTMTENQLTASTNVLIAAKPCAMGTSTSGFGLIGRCRPRGSASSCAIISSVTSESGGSGELAAPSGLSGTTTADPSVGVGVGARRSPALPAG